MEVSNKTLDEQATEIAEQPKVPVGYMTMELSTKGKFGAPKVFHIRNFKTEDLVGLAIEDEDKMQEAAADMLQDLIFEKDVDVKKFHQKKDERELRELKKLFSVKYPSCSKQNLVFVQKQFLVS